MSNYPGGSVSGVCPKHQVPMISTITEKTLCAVCVSAELETYKNFFERLFAIVGPILPHTHKPHSELRAMMDKVLEMKRVESERNEWLRWFFLAVSHHQTKGAFAGWHDTMGSDIAIQAGDRLVELGLYEKKEGVGRRQYYRPKQGSTA